MQLAECKMSLKKLCSPPLLVHVNARRCVPAADTPSPRPWGSPSTQAHVCGLQGPPSAIPALPTCSSSCSQGSGANGLQALAQSRSSSGSWGGCAMAGGCSACSKTPRGSMAPDALQSSACFRLYVCSVYFLCLLLI